MQGQKYEPFKLLSHLRSRVIRDSSDNYKIVDVRDSFRHIATVAAMPPCPRMSCEHESRCAARRRGSEAWQLVEGLGQKPDDTIITEKNTYDAFQNTSLESLLRRWGVDTVIVGGVITYACCETTARCVPATSS